VTWSEMELPDQRDEPLALRIGPRAVPDHTDDYPPRPNSDDATRRR
jgi:hypothetical protein